MIRKRSEHGLGHLLNPLDPDQDDRDWITDIYPRLIDEPETLLTRGPDWLDLPALTRIALTTNEVARAFSTYNSDRPWPEQVNPSTSCCTPTSTPSAIRLASTPPTSA